MCSLMQIERYPPWIITGPPHTLEDEEYLIQLFKTSPKCSCFGADDTLVSSLSNTQPFPRLAIGAQPIINPQTWLTKLYSKQSFRAQIHRALNKKVAVTQVNSDTLTNMTELNTCLAEWIAHKHMPPMAFLLDAHLHNLEKKRVWRVTLDTKPIGYMIIAPEPRVKGWTIQHLIRGHLAPNGTSELMIYECVRILALEGVTRVNLGMVPLSQHTQHLDQNPFLIRWLMRWMKAHANRFYHFKGLESFREKLHPDHWETVWLITSQKSFSCESGLTLAKAFNIPASSPFSPSQ